MATTNPFSQTIYKVTFKTAYYSDLKVLYVASTDMESAIYKINILLPNNIIDSISIYEENILIINNG